MVAPSEMSEALRMALRAMQDGTWDHRAEEGAKLNALDSIAWSLIGILAHLEAQAHEPVHVSSAARRRHRDEVATSPLKPFA